MIRVIKIEKDKHGVIIYKKIQVQLDEFWCLCEEIAEIYTQFDIKHHNNDNNKK